MGLDSHGGAFGIILSIMIYCKKYNESFIWLISRLTIPVALAASFIRLGNLFNSEIIGNETNVFWGVTFLRRTDLTEVPRHPTQVYESLAYIFIFAILLILYKYFKEKDLLLLGVFFVAVFTARFLIDFFKIKQESYNSNLTLNTGQLLSIPFILIGIFCLYFNWIKEIKYEK